MDKEKVHYFEELFEKYKYLAPLLQWNKHQQWYQAKITGSILANNAATEAWKFKKNKYRSSQGNCGN